MITGHKVVLRPVEDGDIPLIHRWMNSPEVWRGMDYERPFSLTDVREDVERSRSDGVPFTIVVDGQPIGRILHVILPNGQKLIAANPTTPESRPVAPVPVQ